MNQLEYLSWNGYGEIKDDEKGKLMRYMVFSDIKLMENRKMPTNWTMYNKTKEGYSTSFKLIDMEFDVNIPDRKFSFQELERGN